MTPPAPEALASARVFLEGVVRRLEIDVRVRVAGEGGLVLEGEAADLLVGGEGKTLDALEHLVNRLRTSRSAPGGERPGRIEVDAEGYRKRRREELTALALDAAERVRSGEEPVRFEGLTAAERRIVHLALAGAPGVRTASEGEGDERRLTVLRAEDPEGGA